MSGLVLHTLITATVTKQTREERIVPVIVLPDTVAYKFRKDMNYGKPRLIQIRFDR